MGRVLISYLIDRKQLVIVSVVEFNSYTLTCGVPRGNKYMVLIQFQQQNVCQPSQTMPTETAALLMGES